MKRFTIILITTGLAMGLLSCNQFGNSFTTDEDLKGKDNAGATPITPDTTPPTLLSSTPNDTATGVLPCSGNPCKANITLVFSESMNTGPSQTLTTEIYNGASYVAALNTGTTFTWSTTTVANDTLTIDFSTSWVWLPENSQIRYTLAAANLKDVAGNVIVADVTRSFTTTTASQGFNVADTGITDCYNDTVSDTCANTAASFPRQDGDYPDTPNARNFTGPTQYAATSDYTTTDNVTGLVWKSCSEGQTGSNCQTSGNAGDNYGANSVQPSWYNALNQCSALNSMNAGAGYGGRNTWRLPTIEELDTLPNYNAISPAIDTANFPATVASGYWSSSTYVGSFNLAWSVNFSDGSSVASNKANSYYVRCVTTGP